MVTRTTPFLPVTSAELEPLEPRLLLSASQWDAPRVVDLWPAPETTEALVSSVVARFSEPVHIQDSTAGGFWISSDPGADGAFGTSDDTRIGGAVLWGPDRLAATFVPHLERLPDGTYAAVIEDRVKDVSGNALDGEWRGVFPSGDGVPGGDFVAVFHVSHRCEIRGSKFNDLDGDGVWDPNGLEPPLGGWKIYVDVNADGQWSQGEPFQYTGNNGEYGIEVWPGTHIVAEVAREGWRQTHPSAGHGPQWRVNEHTLGEQSYPAAATDAGGNFVVAWQSSHQYNPDGQYGQGIYARLYDAGGVAQSAEFRVDASSTWDWDTAPAAARDAEGNFVIVWNSDDFTDGPGYADVHGQMYNAHGDPIGEQFQVNSDKLAASVQCDVARSASGQFVVVWAGDMWDANDLDVYARVYSPNGEPLGGEMRVNTYAAGPQSAPSVAVGPGGNFVVAWMGEGPGGSDNADESWGIYARVIRTDDSLTADQFRVDKPGWGRDGNPSAAMDADGNFTIAWDDEYPCLCLVPCVDVFARMYHPDGTPKGEEFRVNAEIMGADQHPSAAMDDEGRLVVAWSASYLYGTTPEIYRESDVLARMFLPDGKPYGEPFTVNDDLPGNQSQAAAAMADNANIVVAWTDSRTAAGTADESDVYVKQLMGFGLEGAHKVVLAPGDVARDVDFGNVARPGQIHGAKFNDLDRDGEWDDNEVGLEDWTIYLDLDNDGRLDPPTPAMTGVIEPDEFHVGQPIVDPNGFVQLSHAASGSAVVAAESLLNDPSAASHVFGWTAETGQINAVWSEDTSILAAIFAEPVSTISLEFIGPFRGYHQGWLEVFDASGELLEKLYTAVIPGPNSETLTLTRSANEIAYMRASGVADLAAVMLDRLVFARQGTPGEPATTTGPNGSYAFTDLPPGLYTVAEITQPGWRQTHPPPGAILVDAKSWQVAQHSGALDFNIHDVGMGFTGDPALNTDITLEVLWSSTSHALIPGATTYTVAGNHITIDLYSSVTDIGLPVVYTEYETVHITGLAAGEYFISATLHEPAGPMLPAFYPSWEAAGEAIVQPGGCHFVELGEGEIVTGVDFGNYQVIPQVSIVATDPHAWEVGLDNGTFTVRRTGDTSSAMTVHYEIAVGPGQATNGVDYEAIDTFVVIEAGESARSFDVVPIPDNQAEGAETVTLTLRPAAVHQAGAPQTATVVIEDAPASDVVELQIDLYTDAGGQPGERIVNDTVRVGQRFFVVVSAADTRPDPAGLIGLAIDLAWQGELLDEIDDPFDPAEAASPLICGEFELYRAGALDQFAGLIDELGGGSWPAAGIGEAIGVGSLQTFSVMHFQAEHTAAVDTPLALTVGADGISLADGATDFTVRIEPQTLTILPIPRIAVTDSSDDPDDHRIRFMTALSAYRPGAADSTLVRPACPDAGQYVDVTNTGFSPLTIFEVRITAPNVTVHAPLPAGASADLVLEPGQTQRFQLTYAPVLPTPDDATTESFDLPDGLVILSDAVDTPIVEVALRGDSTFNADVSYSGRVDLGELGPLNVGFRTTAGDPNFDPTADVNGDGAVNLSDLGVLNVEFGRELPPAVAPAWAAQPAAAAAAAVAAPDSTVPPVTAGDDGGVSAIAPASTLQAAAAAAMYLSADADDDPPSPGQVDSPLDLNPAAATTETTAHVEPSAEGGGTPLTVPSPVGRPSVGAGAVGESGLALTDIAGTIGVDVDVDVSPAICQDQRE